MKVAAVLTGLALLVCAQAGMAVQNHGGDLDRSFGHNGIARVKVEPRLGVGAGIVEAPKRQIVQGGLG